MSSFQPSDFSSIAIVTIFVVYWKVTITKWIIVKCNKKVSMVSKE